MIEIRCCEKGDVFVTKDSVPLSSPYGTSSQFWPRLFEQNYVTFKFDSMQQAINMLPQYLAAWAGQLPKAARLERKLSVVASIDDLKSKIPLLSASPEHAPELAALLKEILNLTRAASL